MSNYKAVGEFFAQHLPPRVRETVDFGSIQQQKDSFIGDNLKQQIADLLFAVKFSNKSGGIYVLVEHQSTPDRLMPLRILEYIVAIMRQHLRKLKVLELPVVYPIIFYSGRKNYSYSTDLFDLFGDNKSLAKKSVMFLPYQLVDLSKMSYRKAKRGALYSICARVMKMAHEKDKKILVTFLKQIAQELRFFKDSGVDIGCVYATLSYIVEVFEVSRKELRKIIRKYLDFIEEKKVMSIAEQYRQDGLEQGLEQGLERGLRKGKTETLKAMTIRLFDRGMSASEIAAITGLSASKIKSFQDHSSD